MIRPPHLSSKSVGAPAESDPDVATILTYLDQLARREGGYHLRGVFGWAHLSDLHQQLHQRFPEALPRLHRDALLDREDVALPGTRPTYVYRITDAGARASARAGAYAYQTVAPLGPAGEVRPVFLSPAAALALAVLRAVHAEQADVDEGERRWITGKELTRRCRGFWTHPGALQRTDWGALKHLERIGYAERRSGGTRATVQWRASTAGRAAPVLLWHQPQGAGA